MKYNLSNNEAVDLLINDKNAGWTIAGAKLMVDFFEKTFPEAYFNTVNVRCAFAQYSFKDLLNDYSHEFNGYDLEEIEDEEQIDFVKHLKAKGIVVAYDQDLEIAIVDQNA